MPVKLRNALFPIGYQPWYVFEAKLASDATTFDKFDILVPTLGVYKRAAADAVLVTGFVVALENWSKGGQTLAVATPGSLVPGVLGGTVTPGAMLKITLGAAAVGMKYVTASATDLAAGKVVGRYRSNQTNHKSLTAGADGDIIEIQTGVI